MASNMNRYEVTYLTQVTHHLSFLVFLSLFLSVCLPISVQVYYKQKDYWRFVWCLRSISPKLASHVEQVTHTHTNLNKSLLHYN